MNDQLTRFFNFTLQLNL